MITKRIEQSNSIVLISGGPQQLLALIALMRQMKKIEEVSGVISYVSGDDRLIEFEKYICNVFGFNYLGSIVGLNDKIIEYGFGSFSKCLDTFLNNDIQLKVKKWLMEIDLWSSLNNAQIAMPYRPNLMADNLLLNTLSPDDVYLVPDGFDLTMDRNLVKRFASYLLRVDNYFKKKSCQIFSPGYLRENNINHFVFNSLDEHFMSGVYGALALNLKKRIDESLKTGDVGSISILLWNNIYPKYLKNKKLMLDLFLKIVGREIKHNPNYLLVKPHPRSSSSEIDELKLALPSSMTHSVTVLEDDTLVACPVEVFQKAFNVTRVSGVYSTGLLALSRTKCLDVAVYSSSLFPRRLRSEIKRFSSVIGIEPVEL